MSKPIVLQGLDTANTQLSQKASRVFVTPEEFGAAGDGSTDDTSALQTAINYCITNKITLKSFNKKIYCVSAKLTINNVIYMDFNNGVIKATTSVPSIIEINHPSSGGGIGSFYGCIRNLTLDLNNTAVIGLNIVYARRKKLENINFENVSGTAYKIVGGYEIMASSWNITGTNASSIGMYLGCSDCHYTNILMVNVHTAIKNYGLNFLTRVHAWIYDPTYLTGSVFIEGNGGMLNLVSCYSDTYYYAFYFKAIMHLRCTNLHYIINETVYNNTTMPGNLPYVMYFDSAAYSKYVNLTNSYIKGTTYSSSKLHNLTNDEFKGQFNYDNWVEYLSNGTSKTNKGTLTISNVNFTLVSGNIEKRNGMAFLDYVVSVNASSLTSGFDYTAINLPTGFIPITPILATADYATSQYEYSSGAIYNYISSGVHIKTSPGMSGTIYIRGHFSYLTAQDN